MPLASLVSPYQALKFATPFQIARVQIGVEIEPGAGSETQVGQYSSVEGQGKETTLVEAE